MELLHACESGLITKQRSEDRVNDPRLLSDQDLDIAAMPGGARQLFKLIFKDLKVLANSRATRRNPHGSRQRTIKRYSSRRL